MELLKLCFMLEPAEGFVSGKKTDDLVGHIYVQLKKWISEAVGKDLPSFCVHPEGHQNSSSDGNDSSKLDLRSS